MAKLQVMTLDNLTLYDGLIKGYIDDAAAAVDAKSLKTVALVGNTLKFYNVSEPVGETTPVYEITLPETDLSGLITKMANAKAGNVVVANADGTVADGNVALADLATKTEVEAVDEKADKNAEDIKALQTDKANAADVYTKEEVDAAIEASEYDDTQVKTDIKANSDAIAAINDAETGILKTAQTYADGKVKELEDGQVATNKAAIETLNGDASTEGSVAKAVKDASDAINATIGDVVEGKTVVEMINDAKTAATYDDTEVRELIADNAEAIEAHKTAVDGTVTTLVGNDTGKSVRTIANEELAAQLLSGSADADFKTLQELAAWLEDHPEDVAEINLNISNLQKLVGTLPEDATATDIVGYIAEAVSAEKSRAEGVESGLDTRIKAVEDAIGEGGSVDTQIDNKIAGLDADVASAEVEAGKGLQVQVVEADGKITNVVVSGNYDETYEAKGAAKALEDGKIKDLEDKVGDGFEVIGEAEINALFS